MIYDVVYLYLCRLRISFLYNIKLIFTGIELALSIEDAVGNIYVVFITGIHYFILE